MSKDNNAKEDVKLVMDSMTLMANANIELNLRRRDLMRPDLNAQYQRLCAPSVPITNLLFGDDLTKEVKDINATNKVGYKIGRGGDARGLGRRRGFGITITTPTDITLRQKSTEEYKPSTRATTPPEVTAWAEDDRTTNGAKTSNHNCPKHLGRGQQG